MNELKNLNTCTSATVYMRYFQGGNPPFETDACHIFVFCIYNV